LHLDVIARIVLPTDWAMCGVLWYGMVLLAHPHGYPHAMHIFCGHPKGDANVLPHFSPLPSRSSMRMTAKDLSERDDSTPSSGFVPWSEPMSAHDTKIRYAVYRCACVIRNFSSSRGD